MNRSCKKRVQIDVLPTEIMEEILLRLPVKTLFRLKAVCKNWRALIGSQYFINRHLGHSSNHNQECLLLQLRKPSKRSYTFAMYADNGGDELSPANHLPQLTMPHHSGSILALLGPANGLFCTVNRLGRVVLSNPAMREIRPLPPLPLHDHHPTLRPCLLAFGFGFSGDSNNYKVVAFPRIASNFACVYSLSSDSWKTIEGNYSVNYAHNSKSNTFLNGVYYWLVELVDDGGFAILAFDMRRDKFEETLQLPNCLRFTEREVEVVGAWGDSIAIMSCEGLDVGVGLWVMGRDGLWSKTFCVHDQITRWPLCVWRKNEVLFQTPTSALIMCHVSTHKLRKLVGSKLDPFFVYGVFSYKESLVSIKGELNRDDSVPD
ncbi:hypothetical protein C2S51_006132 [Perilla frutescens var. frutescens]|nr:hypothetical protein C2S51_006132 [Perilla frutescens var. frutescens]